MLICAQAMEGTNRRASLKSARASSNLRAGKEVGKWRSSRVVKYISMYTHTYMWWCGGCAYVHNCIDSGDHNKTKMGGDKRGGEGKRLERGGV